MRIIVLLNLLLVKKKPLNLIRRFEEEKSTFFDKTEQTKSKIICPKEVM